MEGNVLDFNQKRVEAQEEKERIQEYCADLLAELQKKGMPLSDAYRKCKEVEDNMKIRDITLPNAPNVSLLCSSTDRYVGKLIPTSILRKHIENFDNLWGERLDNTLWELGIDTKNHSFVVKELYCNCGDGGKLQEVVSGIERTDNGWTAKRDGSYNPYASEEVCDIGWGKRYGEGIKTLMKKELGGVTERDREGESSLALALDVINGCNWVS